MTFTLLFTHFFTGDVFKLYIKSRRSHILSVRYAPEGKTYGRKCQYIQCVCALVCVCVHVKLQENEGGGGGVISWSC